MGWAWAGPRFSRRGCEREEWLGLVRFSDVPGLFQMGVRVDFGWSDFPMFLGWAVQNGFGAKGNESETNSLRAVQNGFLGCSKWFGAIGNEQSKKAWCLRTTCWCDS